MRCRLLQQPERGVSRLKRVVLIGDHHQLPPVIKNHAIQKSAAALPGRRAYLVRCLSAEIHSRIVEHVCQKVSPTAACPSHSPRPSTISQRCAQLSRLAPLDVKRP